MCPDCRETFTIIVADSAKGSATRAVFTRAQCHPVVLHSQSSLASFLPQPLCICRPPLPLSSIPSPPVCSLALHIHRSPLLLLGTKETED